MSWVDEELGGIELGDARRERRLIKRVEDLAAQPSGSIPQASGGWAETKAAYRLCAGRVRGAAAQSLWRMTLRFSALRAFHPILCLTRVYARWEGMQKVQVFAVAIAAAKEAFIPTS